MRKVYILLIMLVIYSCSSGSKELTRGDWLDPDARKFEPTVYLMKVTDGQERNGEISYGSGNYVQLEIKHVMDDRGIDAYSSNEIDLTKALEHAKDKKYNYVMNVKIVEWENNATEWSGVPDAATANLELYSVDSGELVATSYCRKRGTYMSVGPGKPDRFLSYIAKELIDEVFHYVD